LAARLVESPESPWAEACLPLFIHRAMYCSTVSMRDKIKLMSARTKSLKYSMHVLNGKFI
jgi:hypothetical protein